MTTEFKKAFTVRGERAIGTFDQGGSCDPKLARVGENINVGRCTLVLVGGQGDTTNDTASNTCRYAYSQHQACHLNQNRSQLFVCLFGYSIDGRV